VHTDLLKYLLRKAANREHSPWTSEWFRESRSNQKVNELNAGVNF